MREGPRPGLVFGAGAGVLLWRGAAYLWPSSLVSVPGSLRLPFALLGLLFLVCGVAAWLMRPSRWTAVFLLYGLGGGVHWGGAIGAPHAGLELSLFFAYLGLTALGDAALLHLALIYPGGGALARGLRVALYAPAALAVLLAPLAGVVPETILETIAGLLLLIANLCSLAAGLVLLGRLLQIDPATRRTPSSHRDRPDQFGCRRASRGGRGSAGAIGGLEPDAGSHSDLPGRRSGLALTRLVSRGGRRDPDAAGVTDSRLSPNPFSQIRYGGNG